MPLLVALLALCPALAAYLVRQRWDAPAWPFLAAGVALPFALAWWPAAVDRRRRRALQRELRQALERLPDQGTLIEGRLVFVRPQGDESGYSIETRSQRPGDTFRPDWLAAMETPTQPGLRLRGETSSPADAMVGLGLATERGQVMLDGPVHVFLGSHEETRATHDALEHRRRLSEGDRVLARGQSIEEVSTDGRESPFRHTNLWLRLEPATDAGGARAIPLLSMEPPVMRGAIYRPVLWALLALSGLSTLGTIALAGTHRTPQIVSSCVEETAWALEQGDPQAALRRVHDCPSPELEGRAHWMMANFTASSRVFARSERPVSSPTEVEAHALAGDWRRAARAVRRMTTGTLPHQRLRDDERACLAAAFEAREPGARIGAENPLRRQGNPTCYALAQDLKLLHNLSDNELPAAPRPAWSDQRALDMVMALLPTLRSSLRPDQVVAQGVIPVDFTPTSGRDPRTHHRRHPVALFAYLLDRLGPTPEGEGPELSKRRALAAELAVEVALFHGYTGDTERAMKALDAVRVYALDPQSEQSTIDEAQRARLAPFVDASSYYGHRRHLVMSGAWAAYHAGHDEEALKLARLTNDSHSAGMMERWMALRQGRRTVDVSWWQREEPWSPNRELHAMAEKGDAREAVRWMRQHRQDGRGVLERLAPHLTENRGELEGFVARYPTRCWDCGLGALVENLADRRALARQLGMTRLADSLKPLLDRAVAARLGREVAVPLLLVEQFRDY